MMQQFFSEFLNGMDISQALLIVFNLIIIESLLSIDNAAILATMVMDLPKKDRNKALKYGIFGAYFFRGICLLLASFLVKIWWFKPIGGAYLLFLVYNYFNNQTTDENIKKDKNFVYKFLEKHIGLFWSTVVFIEIMDLVFSIDNVLAAAAYVEKVPQPTQTYLLWLGVFIGILAMRFVAQFFVKLMEKYPFLEKSAFVVIFILGLKLILSGLAHLFGAQSKFAQIVDSHAVDEYLSIITSLVFIVPIVTSFFFNYPKKRKNEHSNLKDELDDFENIQE